MKAFDRKLGRDFLSSLPDSPGVYLVYASDGTLVYVGKAKNLRRRLAQYRNAKRRKKHFRMRAIVGDAARIEHEPCATELDACLREARLIQDRRPKWNVAGAFHFMYPMLGIRHGPEGTTLCYTTEPGLFPGYSLHGAFRSREIVKASFEALVRLLGILGYRDAGARGRKPPRFSRMALVRGLPAEWERSLGAFWDGSSRDAIEEMVLALADSPGARRSRREIQRLLDDLKRFWRHEAIPLRRARERTAYPSYPVPQRERDVLFIGFRHGAGAPEILAPVPVCSD